jgi:hypothetical protein
MSDRSAVGFPFPLPHPDRSFPAEAGEFVGRGLQLRHQHLAGPFWHGVISAGEDIHGGVARFRPGVDGDMRFGEEGQSCHPLWIEAVGDQMQECGTSTFGCACDGVPQESFVIELGAVAFVKLENAMFAHRFGGCRGGGGGGGRRGHAPSRVGMQARQALIHQGSSGHRLPT